MSIWGKVQDSTSIFRGCRFVSTSSHGGIILTSSAMAKHQSLEKLRTYPEIQQYDKNGTFYFEEDSEAFMVLYLLDDETLQRLYPNSTSERIRELALISFIQYNPSYFTHVTGKELSVFDSPRLWDEFIKSNPNHYFIRTAFSEISFNVPAGYVYFIVENGNKERLGLLAPKDEYKQLRAISNIPVDVSKYQRFDHDEDMPYIKPSNKVENAFLVVKERFEPNSRDVLIAKAFSYETNEFKYFRMTTDFSISQCRKEDSKLWIAYKDAEHTQLTEDFDLFVQEVDQAEYNKCNEFIRFNKVA